MTICDASNIQIIMDIVEELAIKTERIFTLTRPELRDCMDDLEIQHAMQLLILSWNRDAVKCDMYFTFIKVTPDEPGRNSSLLERPQILTLHYKGRLPAKKPASTTAGTG